MILQTKPHADSPRLAGANVASSKIFASVSIDASILSILTLIDIGTQCAVNEFVAFITATDITAIGIRAAVLALMCAVGTLIYIDTFVVDHFKTGTKNQYNWV